MSKQERTHRIGSVILQGSLLRNYLPVIVTDFGLEGNNFLILSPLQGKPASDVIDFIVKFQESETAVNSQEDEKCDDMNKDIVFHDDVNGSEHVDKNMVMRARMLEIEFFLRTGNIWVFDVRDCSSTLFQPNLHPSILLVGIGSQVGPPRPYLIM